MGAPFWAAYLSVIYLAPVHASECMDGRCYYLGDPHAHTAVSGDAAASDAGPACAGCGSLAGVFERARENGLDWVAFPDHINTTRPDGSPVAEESLYNAFLQRVLEEDDPDGGLVTVPAAEVWFATPAPGAPGGNRPLGHKTLLLFGGAADLAGLTMADLQFDGPRATVTGCDQIGGWAEGLAQRWGPLLLMPHHPALRMPMPTDWGCHHPAFEPLAEVHSEHGSSLQRVVTYDDAGRPSDPESSVEVAISPERGLRIGFAGGTDAHDTDPGSVCTTDAYGIHNGVGGSLTVAVLPEGARFDRAALYAALVARATYATTGPLVPVRLEFYAIPPGGSPADAWPVGGLGEDPEIPADADLEIRARLPAEAVPWILDVTAHTPDRRLPLTAGGGGEWRLRLPPGEIPPSLWLDVRMSGGEIYGGACDDGGGDDDEHLWLSPSWFEITAPAGGLDAPTDRPEVGYAADLRSDTASDTDVPDSEAGDVEVATGSQSGCGCGGGGAGLVWAWLPGLVPGLRRRSARSGPGRRDHHL